MGGLVGAQVGVVVTSSRRGRGVDWGGRRRHDATTRTGARLRLTSLNPGETPTPQICGD
jgi:hypothetical protein